jgi:asparagine synthase (glutamine-hydrolysing)
MGLRPLFYYSDARRFVFASEPKAIQAVAEHTHVNRNKLATMAFPALRPLFWDESWFENIYPIPAGSSLTLDDQGIRKHTYWTPSLAPRLTYKNDREIIEAFQEIMFEAVRSRLQGPGSAAALLSGGLDSSGIVSVAARILERENKELHALCAVLPEADDPQLNDERPFINQFRDWPNVRIHYVTAPARGPFDDLEKLVWDYDSPAITSRHYLYSAFAESAHACGAQSVLDGGGGELGPSSHGEGYYAELLLRLRWFTLCRELVLRRKRYGEPLWRSLRTDVIHPLIPTAILERFRPTPAEDRTLIQQQPLQIQFAETQLAARLKEHRPSTRSYLRISPNHRRVQRERIRLVQLKSTNIGGVIGHTSLKMLFPYMDKRLLEFCLSVPGHLKVRNGYKRYLIRAGLDTILPPAIQWRTTKQPFSTDYLRRYNAQRKLAQTILEEIHPGDPIRTIVDVERLKQLAALPVADNERGTFAESVALHAVPQGIYLICFLRRFDEFRN